MKLLGIKTEKMECDWKSMKDAPYDGTVVIGLHQGGEESLMFWTDERT